MCRFDASFRLPKNLHNCSWCLALLTWHGYCSSPTLMEIGLTSFFVIFTTIFFYHFCWIGLTHRQWIENYFKFQQQNRELKRDLPFLLLQLSSYLQAGHALPQALKNMAVSRTGKLLQIYANSSSVDHGDSSLSFLRLCFKFSQKNGISLSPLLVKFSEILRQNDAMHQKLILLTFPMRAQAIIALLLPWFVMGIFSFLDSKLISDALSDPYGIVGYSSAIILQGGALLWIRKILN